MILLIYFYPSTGWPQADAQPRAYSESALLVGHQASVHCLAFSPDGKILASGASTIGQTNKSSELRFWNLQACKPLSKHDLGCCTVYALAFSPDGKSLAVGTLQGKVIIWDVASGKPRLRVTDPSGVFSLGYSPDGKLFATGGAESASVRLWDSVSGNLLTSIKGREGSAIPLAFSPKQGTLASGLSDTIMLSDARTGRMLTRFHQEAPVTALAFSPNGRLIAASDLDEFVPTKLWDVNTKQLRMEFPTSSTTIAFHPNGELLATVRDGMKIWFWNLMTGKPDFILKGHRTWGNTWNNRPMGTGGVILSMAISPDGRTLAAGGDDNTIMLWNLRNMIAK